MCVCVNVCLCSCTSSSSCCVASACSQLLQSSNCEAPWADIYEKQFRHFVAALDESEVPDMVVLMAVEPSDVQPLWTARGACRSTQHMKLESERVEREEFADVQLTVFKRRINSGASKSMSRKNAARSSGPWHWPVVPPCSLPVTNTGQCTTGSGPSLSPHKLCRMEHWPRLRSVHQWHHAEPATRCFSPERPLQRWTTPSGRTTSSTKRSGPWSSQRGASRRNTVTRKPLRLRTMRSIAPWRYTILSQHWTSLDRIALEVTIRRRLDGERMEESSRMVMFMFEPAARTVSIRVYGRYQNRREEKQS